MGIYVLTLDSVILYKYITWKGNLEGTKQHHKNVMNVFIFEVTC